MNFKDTQGKDIREGHIIRKGHGFHCRHPRLINSCVVCINGIYLPINEVAKGCRGHGVSGDGNDYRGG